MTPRKKARIRTLADLDANSPGGGGGADGGVDPKYHRPIPRNPALAATSSNNNHKAPSSSDATSFCFQVAHIPTLPNADAALALLQRVCKEFEPIVQRRGYAVKSVSEMCCCGDGLDYAKGGGRKKRIMPNNVWGYNQTTTRGRSKSHTVHLRLRHPQSHDRLLLYEDVAGTMAHELAHCEIGPHNDKFHKLMDEILEEHMVLQCQQQTTGGGGGKFSGATASASSSTMPMGFPGKGVALGGNDNKTAITNPRNPGYKLGGDNAFTKFLSPKEAACMAAEARRRQQKLRLRGQHCCQPCTITIPDDDDAEPIIEYAAAPTVEAKGNTKKAAATGRKNDHKSSSLASANDGDRKKKAKRPMAAAAAANAGSQQKDAGVIDLTEDSVAIKIPKMASKPVSSNGEEWACLMCTYFNQPMALMCSMCSTQKSA